MRYGWLFVLALVMFLSACSDTAPPAPAASAPTPSLAGQPIPGQYIVVLDAPELSVQSAQDFELSVSRVATDLGVQATTPLRVINGFVAENVSRAELRQLQNDTRVAYVEQDQIMTSQRHSG